jgi:hypothetical protein
VGLAAKYHVWGWWFDVAEEFKQRGLPLGLAQKNIPQTPLKRRWGMLLFWT